jgi:Skp family chaperone for outer membrane proteins
MIRRFSAAALFVAVAGLLPAMLLPATPARSQDYFVPPQQQRPPASPARPAQAARPQPQPQRAPVQVAPQPLATVQDDQQQPPPLQVQLPPPPDIPALPRGPSPPAAVVGVLGVPEIMRASTAAQQVEKTIGARREKLNEDAQKEQAAWRELQQALANDRGKLSAEQIHTREQELQNRITNAQREFRERGTIIQQAAQYGLAQIERALVGVIQKVAESRGMNLVLHRQQVALNVNEFDITDQVTEQINKILPSVIIPPDGVSPAAMAQAKPADDHPAAAAAAAPPPKK